jgi:hypothetical protein
MLGKKGFSYFRFSWNRSKPKNDSTFTHYLVFPDTKYSTPESVFIFKYKDGAHARRISGY